MSIQHCTQSCLARQAPQPAAERDFLRESSLLILTPSQTTISQYQSYLINYFNPQGIRRTSLLEEVGPELLLPAASTLETLMTPLQRMPRFIVNDTAQRS